MHRLQKCKYLFCSIQAIPLLQAWRFFICQDITNDHSILLNSREANGFADAKICHSDEINQRVAMVNGYFRALGICLAIITILPWGRFSDAKGRRIAFRASYMGIVVSHVLTVIAIWSWRITGVLGLYLAALVLGAFGGWSLLSATYYAMLTDVLHQEVRLVWYARAVGIWYSGQIIGPAIGSFLMSQQLLLPIYFTTSLAIVNLIIVFCLPETLKIQPKSSNNKRRFLFEELQGSFAAMLLCARNTRMILISLTSFACYFSFSIVAVLVQYVNTQCHWSMEYAGYLSSLSAAAKFTIATCLLPFIKSLIHKRWSTNDSALNIIVAKFSFAVDAVSWLLVAVLPTSFLIPSLGLGTLGIGVSSALRSLAVAEIPPSEHGRLFACLGVVDALGVLVASPVLAWLYGATLSRYPEAAFVFVALIFAMCAIAFYGYKERPGIGVAGDCVLYQSLEQESENTDIAIGI